MPKVLQIQIISFIFFINRLTFQKPVKTNSYLAPAIEVPFTSVRPHSHRDFAPAIRIHCCLFVMQEHFSHTPETVFCMNRIRDSSLKYMETKYPVQGTRGKTELVRYEHGAVCMV